MFLQLKIFIITFLLSISRANVRELAYDALDEFITRMKILKHRRRLKHGLSFIKKFIVYHKFATEAQQIKRRVKEANDRRLAYHLEAARDEGAPSNDSITHWRDPRLVFSSWRNLTSWGSTSPFLVVFDDVWTREVNNLINSTLSEFENRSRIIITARDKRVANMMWNGSRVFEDPQWEVHEGGGHVSRVLSFSYNDLPLHLKSCFLYCSLFSEDFEIDMHILISLWIAEWFIEERPRKVMEHIADEYFRKLLDRSMLLVGEFEDDRDVLYCRVHDVTHEFALSIAKEEILGEFYGGECKFEPREESRGLFIVGDYMENLKNRDMSRLRSLLVFGGTSPEPLSCRFRKLRVLRVEDSEFLQTCITMRDMVHLRYLEIDGTSNNLSEYIHNLVSLQTLFILKFLKMISQSLRRVICEEITFKYPKAMRSLENLQTLVAVNITDVGVVRELGFLTR
ncbi:hypothetical protein AMTRI_Chr10g7930 [Amborella trichopoda]